MAIDVNIAGGKVIATATNTVGKDTVEVDVLDINKNLTSYSTTIAADLVNKFETATVGTTSEDITTVLKEGSTVLISLRK